MPFPLILLAALGAAGAIVLFALTIGKPKR